MSGGASGSGSAEPRRRRGAAWVALLVGLAVVAAIAVGVLRPWSDEAPTAISNDTLEQSAVAPLTGSEVAAARADLLGEPALVVKIDAAPEANGQFDLGEADVVVEAQVEGISRFLAVFHSRGVDEVGPVRSARTTDVDLLPLFGRPLFSHSGGNAGVLEVLGDTGGFQDVSEAVIPEAYRREDSLRVPHDLLADAAELRSVAREPFEPPVPLFWYRGEGEAAPGTLTAGMSVSAGTPVTFAWDRSVPGWRRWAHGEPQVDADGEQLAPTNVVVLEVDHVRSPADDRSAEAVTVGQGRAWVYSQGVLQQGTWSRADRSSYWDLSTPEGPMTLRPGTTWVVLADGRPVELSTQEAGELLAEVGEG